MEQKIACPHCGVVGSARDSLPGAKLRCPRCEKVFLLTQGVLAAAACKVELLGGSPRLPARDELISLVPEPEPVPESVAEVKPVVEELPAAEPEPELEPVLEAVVEVEPVVEELPEAELELELEFEPVLEAVVEVETVVEVLPEAEPEEGQGVEVIAALEAGPLPEIVPETEPVSSVAELESTAMSADICAGCGDSFHPEFLQEVDSKLYCGVCQLRSAAMDAQEKLPKVGGRKLWSMLAALALLGLLALVVLVLMKLGII